MKYPEWLVDLAANPAKTRVGQAAGTASRFLGPATGVAGGILTYMDNKGQGEDEARAITSAAGAGAGGWGGAAAGAALGTALLPGVGTVLGGIGGALAGSALGDKAVDTAWQLGTESDGLKPGTDAYKNHYAGLYQQAKADYVRNPTEDNKRKAESFYAQATGTAPLVADNASKIINDYMDSVKEVTGYGVSDYENPMSQYNQQARGIEKNLRDEMETRTTKAALLGQRNKLAQAGYERMLTAPDRSSENVARMWNAAANFF